MAKDTGVVPLPPRTLKTTLATFWVPLTVVPGEVPRAICTLPPPPVAIAAVPKAEPEVSIFENWSLVESYCKSDSIALMGSELVTFMVSDIIVFCTKLLEFGDTLKLAVPAAEVVPCVTAATTNSVETILTSKALCRWTYACLTRINLSVACFTSVCIILGIVDYLFQFVSTIDKSNTFTIESLDTSP